MATVTESSGTITIANETAQNIESVEARQGLARLRVSGHGYSDGDFVQVSGTVNYDGTYHVMQANNNKIVINTPFVANETVGTVARGCKDWEEVETKTGNSIVKIIFDSQDEVRHYNARVNTIIILTGALYHDPDIETLTSDSTRNNANTIAPFLTIKPTGTYIYGKKTVQNGNTRYSAGCGLVITGLYTASQSDAVWKAAEYGGIYVEGGSFISRGGIIMSARTISFHSSSTTGSAGARGREISGNAPYVDIENTKFVKIITSNQRELRIDVQDTRGGPGINGKIQNAILDGMDFSHRALTDQFSATILNGVILQLARGPWESPVTLRDIDASKNINTYADLYTDDLGAPNNNNGSTENQFKTYNVINSANGSALRIMPKFEFGDDRQRGILQVFKELQFVISDPDGDPIQHVLIHCRDTNNTFRKNTNNLNRTADLTYTGQTDANGSHSFTDTNAILTAVTNIQNENRADLETKDPTWWDSNEASGAYKVDRRGNDDTTNDEFTFYLWPYGYTPSQVTPQCKGLGVLTVPWTLFPDPNITESDRSVVAAYTMFTLTKSTTPHIIGINGTATLDQLYDWLSYTKSLSANAEEPSIDKPIASRDGDKLVLDGYDITIDGGVLNPGTKFKTVKTNRAYTEANGGVGNTGVISAAGVRLLLTTDVTPANCAILAGSNISYHTLPAKPTVPVGSTITILAKADKHIYQKYENIDTDTQTTVDIRHPPNSALDDDTFTADEVAKFTLRDSTDSGTPVVPANEIYICVGAIDLYAQRGKSKNIIDRIMRENKFLKFLLEYTDELSGAPLNGVAVVFNTDRVRADATKIAWHKSSLLTERSRIGVPWWTHGDMAYQAPRGDTGEVIFDGLSTIADVDSATLAEVVSATTTNMDVTDAIANAVWGILTSTLTTPSTIGKHLAELTGGGGGGSNPTAIWNHLVADAQVEGSLGKHLGDLMSGGGGGTTITATVRNEIAAAVWAFVSGQSVHNNLVTLLQRWDERTIEELTQAAKMQIPIGSIPFTTGTYATGYIMHDNLLSLVLASPVSDDITAQCIHTVDGAPADDITYFARPAHTIISVCSNDTHNYFLVQRDSDSSRTLTSYHRANDTADHTPDITNHLPVVAGTQALVSIDGHLAYGVQTSGDVLELHWLRGQIAHNHTTEIPYTDGQPLSLAYTDGQLYAQHAGKMYVFSVQFDIGGITGFEHKYTHDVSGQIVVPLHHSVFVYDNDGHIYPLNADFSRITTQWDAVTLREMRATSAAAHTTTDGKVAEVKSVVDALPTKTQIGEEIRDNIDFDDDVNTTTSLKETLIALSQDMSVIQQLLSTDTVQATDTIFKRVKDMRTKLDNVPKDVWDRRLFHNYEPIQGDDDAEAAIAPTIGRHMYWINTWVQILFNDLRSNGNLYAPSPTLKQKLDGIKAVTDKFNFNPDDDVVCTLNGEPVTTDIPSRTHIEDTISAAHTTTDGKIDAVKMVVDTINDLASVMPAAVWNYHVDNYYTVSNDDTEEAARSPTMGRHVWEMWEWLVTLFNDLRSDGNNFAQSPTLKQKIDAIKERTDKMQYRSEEDDDVTGREQLHTYTDVDVTLSDDTEINVNLGTVETMLEKILNQLTVELVATNGRVKADTTKNTVATYLKQFKDTAEQITYADKLLKARIEITDTYIKYYEQGTDTLLLEFENRGNPTKADYSGGRKEPTPLDLE